MSDCNDSRDGEPSPLAKSFSVALQPNIPRLYYFDARGRAEVIRLLFAAANVQYEDVRCLPHPKGALDDFDLLKKKHVLPFNQLPMLEIDGISLAQSQAIVRYVARKYKLIGANEIETAKADMIACATEDVRQKFTATMLEWSAKKKVSPTTPVETADPEVPVFDDNAPAEMVTNTASGCKVASQTFVKVVLPEWGSYFERLLAENKRKWFVGDTLTFADIAVYDLVSTIQEQLPTAFTMFTGIMQLKSDVEAVPSIASWLAKRPITSL